MKYSQKGAAVIMAILITALAATIATSLLMEQSLRARQLQNQNDEYQARMIAIGGTYWAAAILKDDAQNSQADYLQEAWASRLPPIPVENGEIEGYITDQQGLFNLNNLVSNGKTNFAEKEKFRRLLSLLNLPVNLSDSLADWMDEDSEMQFPGGAEDNYYLGLAEPYRTANQPLTEIANLGKIRGFDQAIIEQLKPFVTVLPQMTVVNVNTAPAEVLAACANISLADARATLAKRDEKYFGNMADFRARTKFSVDDNNFSVTSEYFLVTTKVHLEHINMTMQTLLDRQGNWPITLWQRKI